MKTCKPHNWEIPHPGDSGLTCGECGRHLGFFADMTDNIRAAISNSVQVRRGDQFHGVFMDAWRGAEEADKLNTERRERVLKEKHGHKTHKYEPPAWLDNHHKPTLPKRKRPY